MAISYNRRMQNLRERRYDSELQKAILAESFSEKIPDSIKYILESMQPIEDSYNKKTTEAARRVEELISKNLTTPFKVEFRRQGSTVSNTNIKTYSDIDLLALIGSYHYVQEPLKIVSPYTGDAFADIKELRRQIVNILTNTYDEVDSSGSKSIKLVNKGLKRSVDVVPAFWLNIAKYEETWQEYWRGVHLFDFKKSERLKADFPFAHIEQVNDKGNATSDASKKAIRLLKTLKADAESEVKISSFQLTSIAHSIENARYNVPAMSGLDIGLLISEHLGHLLNNPDVRRNVKSPTNVENPLSEESVVPPMRQLKSELDQILVDCSKEINQYTNLKETVKRYK